MGLVVVVVVVGCSQKGEVSRRTLAVQGKSKRPKAKCTMPRKQKQGR